MSQLSLRITGFVFSLILTLAAYFVIINPDLFHLGNEMATIVIFILAGLQSIVQLVCFINLWKEKDGAWNLSVFLHMGLIIFIVIAFSIWIMNHLNDNMMP
jgi:cytochrome o ubiquinol oxidase subunit IV